MEEKRRGPFRLKVMIRTKIILAQWSPFEKWCFIKISIQLSLPELSITRIDH